MNNQAPLGIILAAGRGSRMGSATRDNPKGMTELSGRPLIAWQVEALRAAGCAEIIAIGGYRWERLAPLVEIRYVNEQWFETNMVATLRCADVELSRRRCLVSYSDIVYHPDLPRRLLAATEGIAITYDRLWADLWRMRFDNPLDDAETFRVSAGKVVEIGAKPLTMAEVEGQYMGLISITPSGWQNIESLCATLPVAQLASLDMTALLSRLLDAGEIIGAVPVDGRWLEVDNVNDLESYEHRLSMKEPWSHNWR
jgi:choline kinase